MPPTLEPGQLTPEERLDEIAAILSTGLLRLRDRAALGGSPADPETAENSTEASSLALDLWADKSVTVHAG
jgi:hypothetical protein